MKKCLIISLSILIIFSLILDGCDKGGAGGTKKPVAIITANPTKGSAPLTIVFTGSGQGGNGTIALYQWDFGDGTTSTEQNPTHTYQIAGTYTVTLKVMDSKGNFSDPATITINVTEADLPAVTDIFPPDGAADVPVNASIRITFNKDMNKDTVRNAFSTSPSVNGDISWEGTTFIFTPVQPLDISSSYTATITNAAKDLEGNNLIASITWTFTTAAPPAVISVEPSDGAEEVALDTAIKVIFSEKMDQLSVKDAFSIVPPVSGNFSWNAEGDTMTFTPDNNLAGSTGYTATVSTDAKDLAGNKLITAVTWSFTTRKQEQPPLVAVVSVNPPDGAKDVKLDTDIEATFNREMNKSSVEDAFSVASGSTASSIEGTFSWSSDGKKVIFDPEDDLARGTKYTVTISTGAKDTEGNRLPANFQWSFDTIPENRPPTVTITSPQQGGIFNKGQEINFQGSAVDPEEGELTGDALVWTSSIDGQIGTGKQFTKSDLSPGDHTITLTATDSGGAKGTATVNISVSMAPLVSPGPAPTGLDWDGQYLWNADANDKKIYKIDIYEGKAVAEIPTPGASPRGLAWDGAYLWNVDLITQKIHKLNPTNGTVIKTISSPEVSPTGLAWDGAYLWNADSYSGKVYKIDPSNGSVVKSFTLPGISCEGLGWGGGYLWSSDVSGKKIYKINPVSGTVVKFLPSPGSTPQDLAYDGTFLWNADWSDALLYNITP